MVSALVILPKIMAFLSFFGSLYIFVTTVRTKKKDSSTYTRLIGGMSFTDLFTSISYLLGTLPVPAESRIDGAIGTEITCNVQAFFLQTGLIIPFYNFFLAIYYLLVVVYGWRDSQINKVEPYMHAIAILAGFGTSIACIVLDIFHESNLWCWIASEFDIYRMAFFLCSVMGMYGRCYNCHSLVMQVSVYDREKSQEVE